VAVHTATISISSQGDCDIIDVTGQVAETVRASGLSNGVVHIFVAGSTAAVTTVEYEPGLVADLQRLFEEVAPRGATYAHDARWQDGNGHAHVRASLVGPSLTVPVADGELVLGTWQQVVVIDFDNRPRNRRLVVHIMGE